MEGLGKSLSGCYHHTLLHAHTELGPLQPHYLFLVPAAMPVPVGGVALASAQSSQVCLAALVGEEVAYVFALLFHLEVSVLIPVGLAFVVES